MLEQSARGVLDVARVRRALVAVLIGAGLLAGVSLSAAAVVGFNLGGEQDELARRIAERRRRCAPAATAARRSRRRCARWSGASTRARRA